MGGYPSEKAGLPSYTSSTDEKATSANNGFSTTSASGSAPSWPAFQSQFASISLHQSDRIRFMQFPAETLAGVRDVITRSYKPGIQDERPYAGSHEIKLKGYPWESIGTYSTSSRVMMRELFSYLYSAGWIVHQTVDLSKVQFDKDTIIFRKQPVPPPQSCWFAMSFNYNDRIRLIGADRDLIGAFQGLLKSMNLYQSETWKETDAFEFKLRGYPWMPTGEATMSMRLLILRMLELLEMNGWSIYASVDQSNAAANSSEADSWYLVKAADWVPGNPVFHR